MFIGEYKHTIDSKKRISLPSKVRKELGASVILTRGLDSCIFVYTLLEWETITSKLASLSLGQASSRGFSRFLLSGANEAEIDGSGRVLIPESLREFAHLQSTVVIAGVNNRLEIWDECKWNEYTNQMTKQADELAESLGSIGMI